MTNVEVFVQPPNQPTKRRSVGWITASVFPDSNDLNRWGINSRAILSQRFRRVQGRLCLVIEEVPK